MPPFWELEDLLVAGLACEAALQVMAARRVALRLVDSREAEEETVAGETAAVATARPFRFVF